MTSDGVAHSGQLDLPRLTSLRWYAALVVFLFHNEGLLLGWRPLRAFFWGQAGVAFFFILSGFVLTFSARPGLPAGVFFRNRFARIYPAHLVTLVVAGVAFWLIPGIGATGWLGLGACLVLLQAWGSGGYPVYAYNQPSWSLSCEAFFYALFPLLHRRMRRERCSRVVTIGLCGLVLGAVATALLAFLGSGSDLAYNNPMVRLPEFVWGMACALALGRGNIRRVPMYAGLIALGAGVVASHGFPLFPLFDYLLIPGFTMIILSGAQADLRGQPGLLTHPVSVYLGRLSFCFYLTHLLASRLLTYSISTAPAMLIVTFIGSLLSAVVLHHFVELPAQRLLRGNAAGTSVRGSN